MIDRLAQTVYFDPCTVLGNVDSFLDGFDLPWPLTIITSAITITTTTIVITLLLLLLPYYYY